MTSAGSGPNPAKAQVTVLYDAFGRDPAMQKDWGYAAFVEMGGKRILFDTGSNGDALAQNAKAKGIDPCPSSISLSCRTAMATTWAAWPTC